MVCYHCYVEKVKKLVVVVDRFDTMMMKRRKEAMVTNEKSEKMRGGGELLWL